MRAGRDAYEKVASSPGGYGKLKGKWPERFFGGRFKKPKVETGVGGTVASPAISSAASPANAQAAKPPTAMGDFNRAFLAGIFSELLVETLPKLMRRR